MPGYRARGYRHWLLRLLLFGRRGLPTDTAGTEGSWLILSHCDVRQFVRTERSCRASLILIIRSGLPWLDGI